MDWTRSRRPCGWDVPWRDCVRWWMVFDAATATDDELDRPADLVDRLRRLLP